MYNEADFLVYCTFDYVLPAKADRRSVSVLIATHRHDDRGNVFAAATEKARLKLFRRQARDGGHLHGVDIHAIELENFRSQDLQTLDFYEELVEERREGERKTSSIKKLEKEIALLKQLWFEEKTALKNSLRDQRFELSNLKSQVQWAQESKATEVISFADFKRISDELKDIVGHAEDPKMSFSLTWSMTSEGVEGQIVSDYFGHSFDCYKITICPEGKTKVEALPTLFDFLFDRQISDRSYWAERGREMIDQIITQKPM